MSHPRDVGPPSVAHCPARSPAGRQPVPWRASGPRPGTGPGSGLGDCQMAFPWAVLPVRPVGRGAVGAPARLVPGPADGTPGRCAGCRRSLGTGALSGVVGVGVYGAEELLGPGAGGVYRGSGTCLCGRAFGRSVCGALRRPDWWAVVWVGLRAGLCCRCLTSCRRLVACGRVGWCMGLWSWVACEARAWACLLVYGAEGLPGSGACCRRICGAGHGSPPCR